MGRSLVRRSTECGVAECDRESRIMGTSWPERGCRAMEKEINIQSLIITLLARSMLETGHRFTTNYISV
jgi:hypothetical protein